MYDTSDRPQLQIGFLLRIRHKRGKEDLSTFLISYISYVSLLLLCVNYIIVNFILNPIFGFT